MAYGQKVEDKKKVPSVGIMDNCEIVGDIFITLSDDNKYLTINFQQEDGAQVVHRAYDKEDDAGQAELNNLIHHIATKVISAEEYEQAVEGSEGFVDFIARVNRALSGQYQNKKFRMIYHYNNKNFVTLPRYPVFIESMDIPKEKSDLHKLMNGNTKQAIFIRSRWKPSEQPKADAENHEAELASGVSDELPF